MTSRAVQEMTPERFIEAIQALGTLVGFYADLGDPSCSTLMRLEWQRIKRWHFMEDEANHPTPAGAKG